jgi:hypothetical protein
MCKTSNLTEARKFAIQFFLSFKKNKNWALRGMTQVVEHLPSNLKAPSSNSSTEKTKKTSGSCW